MVDMSKVLRLLSWTAKHGFVNLYFKIINRRMFDIQKIEEFSVQNSSITDSDFLSAYPTLCGTAASNQTIFNKFRSSKIMVEALDHVSIEQGNAYIAEILKNTNWKESYSNAINEIDKLGKPRKYRFTYGTFSPTLLRYLKVFVDLEKYFGPLKNLNLTEIGIGFGGQASLISKLDKPKSYNFFDIPPVLNLATRFIKELDAQGNFSYYDGRSPTISTQDLVISNYAFSELYRDVQIKYLKNVILPSPRGYITWNSLSAKRLDGLSLAELIRTIPNSEIVAEEPRTSKDNVIIIWGHQQNVGNLLVNKRQFSS
jgi:putative sugar O-methyltransferase